MTDQILQQIADKNQYHHINKSMHNIVESFESSNIIYQLYYSSSVYSSDMSPNGESIYIFISNDCKILVAKKHMIVINMHG